MNAEVETLKLRDSERSTVPYPQVGMVPIGVPADNIRGSAYNLTPLVTSYKNKLINGGFDVWQRGTSGNSPNYDSADRWRLYTQGLAPTHSSYQGWYAILAEVGNTYCSLYQIIESGTFTSKDVGAEFTLSFVLTRAQSGGGIKISYLNSPDNASTITAVYEEARDLKSGLNSFTFTMTGVPENGVQVAIRLGAVTDSNLLIDDVQLELGSVATAFEHRPIGVELAMCQRYYEVCNEPGVTYSGSITNGGAYYAVYKHTVTKRVTPTTVITPALEYGFDPSTLIVFSADVNFSEAKCIANNSVAAGYYTASLVIDAEL